MRNSAFMSGLLLAVSTFVLHAQSRPPATVSMEVEIDPPPTAAKPAPAEDAEAAEGEEAAVDINELIQTATVFTNSAGMVMKKVGGLWVSAYETTQGVYQEVAGANPSHFGGADHPVDSVSWTMAIEFCRQLNEYESSNEMLPDGYTYALPTQAQWEALAANIPLKNAITSSGRSRSGTAAVGSLPGKNGIHDLRGNVGEWCSDPDDGAYRVLRGGSWKDWIEVNLRPEFLTMVPPGDAQNTYGFRCVLIEGSGPAASRRR